MLKQLSIQNFKSLVNLQIDLGKFNLFVGENGCGKTNILEGIAMAAGAEAERLTNEDLFSRGLRIAKSSLTRNSFLNQEKQDAIKISLSFPEVGEDFSAKYRLISLSNKWANLEYEETMQPFVEQAKNDVDIADFVKIVKKYGFQQALQIVNEHLPLSKFSGDIKFDFDVYVKLHSFLRGYVIYSASTLSLRGLQTESHREPLGIFGENLDVAIAQLPDDLRAKLVEHAQMVSWLETIDLDPEGSHKLEGYKLGRSRSNLYFVDKFMSADNKLFSAENANEGILHVLFHLLLFLHPEAPKFFAIDNIETALNPHLLRHLIKTLAQLAKENDRQVLITTHNPAALDGLNLHNDEQRLFVVSRNDEGHTQVRRIQVKPDSPAEGPKLKLSELWMRGMLGGIPTHF